jgi:hypothetical protein
MTPYYEADGVVLDAELFRALAGEGGQTWDETKAAEEKTKVARLC